MLPRLITGFLFAGAVLAIVLLGPPQLVVALIVVVAGIAQGEVYGMMMPGRTLERGVGVAIGAATLSIIGLTQTGDLHHPLLLSICGAAAILVPPLLILARPHPLTGSSVGPAGAGARVMALWGGLLYVVGPFAFGLAFATKPTYLILTCVVVFFGDTGAYFAGRSLGKRKLYELLSPKKTIEGSIGGLAASVGGALLCRALFAEEVSVVTCIALGIGGGAIAQAGDLAESALKRACGVKDSGNILPGHGGMLDRIDGLLFALPIFAIVLAY